MFKKKKYKIISLLVILAILLIPIFDSSIKVINKNKEEKLLVQKITNKEEYYAILEIPKINLKKEIYRIDDKRNNVEKNILVHENSIFPKNIILASHSGNKGNAYFKDLYKLKLKDDITIYYQNKVYKYIIEEIEEQNKTGNLYLKEDLNERIILITCTKNNNKTQMIYYGKLKSISDI